MTMAVLAREKNTAICQRQSTHSAVTGHKEWLTAPPLTAMQKLIVAMPNRKNSANTMLLLLCCGEGEDREDTHERTQAW